ncbi:MAG TPA: PAS and helix-turn-helix domain-containing protein [Phnomibacter sp.]|nr:PAS and helix-turn-helix domain-containing protein [Phnomibacter sp.]
MNHLRQSNLLTVVFSFQDLSILHINQAAAAFFGGTVDEIKHAGAPYIISCFDEEQLKFATMAAEVNAREMNRYRPEQILNSYACYANWIIHNKKGKTYRALFRIFPIQLNNNGLPLLGMYLIHDVMPFLRDTGWWYRSTTDDRHFYHYHSHEKKIQKKDLLSEREKTILRELATGLSSKELAEKIHVSSHTIDNHRRRMLAKTGSVDTSALIHVAKLSGIL